MGYLGVSVQLVIYEARLGDACLPLKGFLIFVR